MSFLNPVNEPVKRFSSTDADAPQINYAARVAGDVKTVLKACLVTGYGAKTSAGWSIANEVDHVAEFVSPSAAMSDYRLGINDSLATKTDWYYQYQNARVNPAYNAPIKSFGFINKTHVDNGWQLFVTERGIVFVELGYNTGAAKLAARITYWGAIKLGLLDNTGQNIAFFNVGENAQIGANSQFYSPSYPHYRLSSYTSASIISALPLARTNADYTTGISSMDMISGLYLSSSDYKTLLGEQPGLLSKVVNIDADMYGISDSTIGSRPFFKCCAGATTNLVDYIYIRGRVFLIPLDYWEY